MMLLLAAVVSPWLFGSVQPWAQFFCLVCSAVGCLFSVFLSPWRRQPASAWLLIAIVALSLGQLVVFSPDLLGWLSPFSLSIRTAFGLDNAGKYPISLEPALTRNAISNLVGIAICYLVAARITSTKLTFFSLALIAVNGCLISVVGILEKQFETDIFYSSVKNATGQETSFGPFVNRNNAAGFLLLSLSASIALFLFSLRSRAVGSSHPPSKSFLEQTRGAVTGRTLVPLLIMIIVVCGILISQSRGGILALVTATACTLCLALQRKHLVRATVVSSMFAVGAAAFLIMVDAWTPVYDRIGVVFDQSQASRDGRLSIWKSCLDYFGNFALTGSGLGTFGQVFRLYDLDADGTFATHAENVFIQLACEGGFLILGLVLVAAVFQLGSAARLLINRHFEFYVLGIAWFFLMVSQLIAGCFDFGLLIPANMYSLAVLSGLFSGTALWSKRPILRPKSGKVSRSGTNARTLPLSERIGLALSKRRFDLVFFSLFFLAILCATDLGNTSSLESLPVGHHSNGRNSQDGPKLSDRDEDAAQFSRLLRNIQFRSDDAKAHFAISEGYISRFESRAAELLGVEAGSIALHSVSARIEQLLRADKQEDIERIVSSTVIAENLKPAYAHLLLARRACCLDPNVHLRLAHLSFMGPETSRVECLERLIRLQEGKRYDSFENGLARFEAGELEMALELWKPCLNARSRYRERVIAFALSSAKLEDLLKSFFPRSERFLVELAEKHLSEPGQSESREIVLQLAQQLKR